jgi:hypothetical protein
MKYIKSLPKCIESQFYSDFDEWSVLTRDVSGKQLPTCQGVLVPSSSGREKFTIFALLASIMSRGVHIPGRQSPWQLNFLQCRRIFFSVLSTELGSYYHPGAYNVEIAPGFLEDLCTPDHVRCVT